MPLTVTIFRLSDTATLSRSVKRRLVSPFHRRVISRASGVTVNVPLMPWVLKRGEFDVCTHMMVTDEVKEVVAEFSDEVASVREVAASVKDVDVSVRDVAASVNDDAA